MTDSGCYLIQNSYLNSRLRFKFDRIFFSKMILFKNSIISDASVYSDLPSHSSLNSEFFEFYELNQYAILSSLYVFPHTPTSGSHEIVIFP